MQYGVGNEYENIIQEAVPAKNLPEIEVTERVMRRIRESEGKRRTTAAAGLAVPGLLRPR